LVRTIGLEKFGLINFALSLGLYFGAVIQYGFGVTATREIARNRDNPEKLAQIYSATLFASCLLALLCVFIFIPIVLLVEQFRAYLKLYLFTIGFIAFQSLFPIWFFQGMEKVKYITFLSLGTSSLFLVSLFAVVKVQEDFMLVPLLNGSIAFVTFIAALVLIKAHFKVKLIFPKWIEVRNIYQSGRDAFISQLAPNLYNNSSVFLLGLFTNSSAVGTYTAVTKIIDSVISFAYILSNTFLPYLSRNLENHHLFQKLMLLSGAALTSATYLFSKQITQLLFGADNIDLANYIQWLSICIFLLFMTMTYGTNFLMLVGKDKIVKNIALFTSLIFFGIALLIIPLWGIWGAIATLAGARFTMAILLFIFYIKYKYLGRTA
jgi:PST family polysaccharide transporter